MGAKKFQFTRKQWYILGALGSVNFTNALCGSLQAPFFPKEAELKGATATEYGLVFGVYELVAFFSCPMYGKYMNHYGAKVILCCGILLAGISIIGFGLLDLIDYHAPFITMAFFMRIFESLGTSAAFTSTYSMTGVVFHDSIATSFAVMKMSFGLGYMLGPTLGGFLYQIGGYMCPFMVVGSVLLIEAGLIFIFLPSIEDNREVALSKVRMCSVLGMLPVFLDLVGTTATAMVIGFLNATLEPHLRQFDLSPVTLGAIFMISTGIYAPLAPLVGYLCDTRFYAKKVIILGCILMIIGVSLVGPTPFIPIETTLWVVCLGLVVNGIGYACTLVPTVIDAIHSAVALGMPNNMALFGLVSGLAQSAFALGDAIGPSIAGVLFDEVGFRKGTIFLLVMQAISLVAMTWYVYTEKRDVDLSFVQPAQSYGAIDKSNEEEHNDEQIPRSIDHILTRHFSFR